MLGFQDVNGNPLGTTLNVSLQAGESASLALNGKTLTSVPGRRVEVQPTVAAAAGVASRCNASAEVFDNLLGINSVVVPGAFGFAANPLFSMIGVTELQTVRVNVVAYPPDPCVGQLSFLNSQGAPAGNALEVRRSRAGRLARLARKCAGDKARPASRSAAGGERAQRRMLRLD